MKREIRGIAPYEIQMNAKAFRNWMKSDEADGDAPQCKSLYCFSRNPSGTRENPQGA